MPFKRIKQSLVTASIGLLEADGKYFIQIITADKYNFYYTEITQQEAMQISEDDSIEISHWESPVIALNGKTELHKVG